MTDRLLTNRAMRGIVCWLCLLQGVVANWKPYTVLEKAPRDSTVVAGDTARFSCDLNIASRYDVIWWLFESSGCFLYISRNDLLRRTCGINMNHYSVEIDRMHHVYTIVIDNVSEEDAGNYICKNETNILASARLTVLPRGTKPTPILSSDCSERVCCELSYYPTGTAPSDEMEAQATCRWPEKYNSIDTHVHLYCDGRELRGTNKVLLSDRAIGKLEPSDRAGCTNFTCNLEILGQRDVKESCSIRSETDKPLAIVKVEPVINFVEEGFNAIFFCHVNNVKPTSGEFTWYIVHTHYASVNAISSKPVASTTGYYGKLELSTVMLDDDFVTVECFFEPSNGANYSAKSNPAVLRVLRRSSTQISCYTDHTSSLLECEDQPNDGTEENGFVLWPLSTKEWILCGIILGLLLIVIFLFCHVIIYKKDDKSNRRTLQDRASPNNENSEHVQQAISNRRYEYLAERHYDAPYSLLRNIRNFPRLLRSRVIHRRYFRNGRSVHNTRSRNAQTDSNPNITYGSTNHGIVQTVRLRDRTPSRAPISDDNDSGDVRNSSDYDVLDASTMNDVFSSQPSSPTSVQDLRTDQAESTADVSRKLSSSMSSMPSLPPRSEHPSTTKRPRVAPRPLSPKPLLPTPLRLPSISNESNAGPSHRATDEPEYVNTNEGYASPTSSPTDRRPQQQVGADGYLQPNQERTHYHNIC